MKKPRKRKIKDNEICVALSRQIFLARKAMEENGDGRLLVTVVSRQMLDAWSRWNTMPGDPEGTRLLGLEYHVESYGGILVVSEKEGLFSMSLPDRWTSALDEP